MDDENLVAKSDLDQALGSGDASETVRKGASEEAASEVSWAAEWEPGETGVTASAQAQAVICERPFCSVVVVGNEDDVASGVAMSFWSSLNWRACGRDGFRSSPYYHVQTSAEYLRLQYRASDLHHLHLHPPHPSPDLTQESLDQYLEE